MNPPEPLRQALMLEADQQRTFETFVHRMSAWWPMEARSPRRLPTEVRVEERSGGRIYRLEPGGGEREWGRLTSWDPPYSFSFVPDGALEVEQTEVVLRFQRLGPALTRVVIEHRGWERLSTALYERHTSHAGGWLAALRRYAAIFEVDGAAVDRRQTSEAPRSD